MKLGDKVEKIKGYKWPGEIVAVFNTKRGEARVVVECTHPVVSGALHVYAPEQLRLMNGGHERDMRCVIGGYIECAARVPEACLCRQMPREVYLDAYDHRYGEARMNELDRFITPPRYKRPINSQSWALCSKQGKRWHVRRIVWGRLLAREEKREGETIVRAAILLKEKP